MTWEKCRPFLIALLFSGAFSALLALAGSGAGVHRFEGRCTQCHLNTPRSGGKILLVSDVDRLCRGCHAQIETVMSHPYGLKPSYPLPPEFKLDWAGRMTCTTCHEIHGSRKYLLVVEKTGKALCLGCHREALFKTNKYNHEVVSSLLHQPQYETAPLGQPLDRESQECLSCHDGGLARERAVNIGGGVWKHAPGSAGSHPVGVDYQQASTKGRYRRKELLNRRVRLFDGKLGCGSCHNLYSTLPAMLVMNNSRSALCFECHLK
jgi:predicted CXXCH cytochrome family protein